jgi:protoporphyrinogen oxidase
VSNENKNKMLSVAILGAGPAGLTAAWCLQNTPELQVQIFDSDSQVGGISKTVNKGNWSFDLGGHRFFSKSTKVNDLWDEMLSPDKFTIRPRKSRIYYNGKYFDYPLKPLNALFNLGIKETLLCILSYIWVRINPPKNQTTFEGWVAARFGWRLYRIFFKTYTEKVWGISTRKLQSTWAAQRIKNLSLLSAIKDAFGFTGKKTLTTLINEFKYPRFGPGQLWENAANVLVKNGIELSLNTPIEAVVISEKYSVYSDGEVKSIADAVFSSLPLSDIPNLLNAPDKVKEAGSRLKFRDFLVVAIPVKLTKELFDDNWIYIHDSSVRVGRIQNYHSWSPDLVLPGTSCLGLEYFVNKNDELWILSDSELITIAREEIVKLGLNCVFTENPGYVVRVEKAYPVYDADYAESTKCIRSWLETEHPNWFQVGRNGQHHYNNQDHSMLTSFHAVNKFLGKEAENYWEINLDDDYHEEVQQSRQAPIFK